MTKMSLLEEIMNGREGEAEIRAKFRAMNVKPVITEPKRTEWVGNTCTIKRDETPSEPYYDLDDDMFCFDLAISG
jgi:hypothetical protein